VTSRNYDDENAVRRICFVARFPRGPENSHASHASSPALEYSLHWARRRGFKKTLDEEKKGFVAGKEKEKKKIMKTGSTLEDGTAAQHPT